MTSKKTSSAKTQPSEKPSRLGRGLSSLLGDSVSVGASDSSQNTVTPSSNNPDEQQNRQIHYLPVEWINPGPWQPRQDFDAEALDELAASIREKGIIQPILVRQNPDNPSRYQLIAGERRWRAAQRAQLHQVPALISTYDDRDAAELSLIENIQRRDLSAIEEAEGYHSLISRHNYTQDELADIVGKSRPHIANLLRLLSLPASVQKMLVNKQLSMGQARALIGHPNAENLAQEIREKGLTVRQVEALISAGKSPKESQSKPDKSSDIRALEENAKIKHGLSISLDWHEDAEKGRLVIRLTSLDQLDDILARLEISPD